MGGILGNKNSRLLTAGGTTDHVHLLVSQSKNIALSELLQDVKKDSSSWLKTQDRAFRNFHWQDGYAAFSVGTSEIATEALHRQSEGASPKDHVSAGIDSVLE